MTAVKPGQIYFLLLAGKSFTKSSAKEAKPPEDLYFYNYFQPRKRKRCKLT